MFPNNGGDDTLERPVYDKDLAFLGSSHGVPIEAGCRWWQAMATREPKSPLQWMHLNPNACGAFALTPWLSWRAWDGLIMSVAIMLSAPRLSPRLSLYCSGTHFSQAKWWKSNTANEATIILHIERDASVAFLWVRHIRFWILREKSYSMCQNFMKDGNKMNSTTVNSKQNNIS